MEKKVWTVNEIREILDKSDEAVTRGVWRIFKLQTEGEQILGATQDRNGVGFNMRHAKTGCYLGRYIDNNGAMKDGKPHLRMLTGRFVKQGREIASFYARQLCDIANGKIAVTIPF